MSAIKILNVDDHTASRYAKSRVLQRAGFIVLEAATGGEALDLLVRENPDLVLLDVKLPDISGFEVCQRIKADPATASTLVLQISATYAETQYKVQSLEGGADGYLTEPVEPSELIATVKALLRLRQAEDAARRSEERLLLAMEAGRVGLWDWDLITNQVMRSSNVEALFGFAPGSFGPTPEAFMAFMHPEDRAHLQQAIARAIETGAGYEVEFCLILPDGTMRWGATSGRAFYDKTGQAVRMAGSYRDITERKRAEETLARQAAELQRSNDALRQFAYVASHDLKEPLRMVTSFTQLLAKRYQGKIDTEADEYIHFVVDGAKRMQILIDDLLTYAQVGTEQQAFSPVDCTALLADTLEALHIAIAESGVVITHDPLPTVWGDAGQLQRLLQNLLSNALKFRAKVTPQVHVSARQDGTHWVFTVRDNGIGLAPRDAEQIFQLFQRLHSRAQYPGTGIGLAICKQIVERHGGSIWVESEPGQGTTFYFSLPMHI